MRLPPLNALRAFEAAARHQGFIGASEELHVTRGAISRQVKLLEDHLGVLLFTRQPKGVKLTAAGKQLLPVLSEAFKQIKQGAEQVTSSASDLRVICPPATSIRWLIPRLENFRRRHPEIRVRLTTDFYGDIGFDSSEYDIGFSVENWPNRSDGIKIQTLFPVLLTPACSPDLLNSGEPIVSPNDISKYTLLHETPSRLDWAAWVEDYNPEGINPDSGEDFPNLDIAAKAAVMGTGFVMADLLLCREELEAGLLIAPFNDLITESPFGGICILGVSEKWNEPKVEAFRTWTLEVAKNDVEYLKSQRR